MSVEPVAEVVSAGTFYWIVGGMGSAFALAMGYVLKQIGALWAAFAIRDTASSAFREDIKERMATRNDIQSLKRELVEEFRASAHGANRR